MYVIYHEGDHMFFGMEISRLKFYQEALHADIPHCFQCPIALMLHQLFYTSPFQ